MGSANTDIATLPAGAGDSLKGLVRAGAAVDAAMMIVDAADNIRWANANQRALMPFEYDGRNYVDFLFAGLERGFVGNPAAIAWPTEWYAASRQHRQIAQLSLNINRYPWGDMVVATRRFDDETWLMTRFATDAAAIGDLPEHALFEAERQRRRADALRQGLDSLSLGISVIDTSARIGYANAALRALADAGAGLRRLDGILQPAHDGDRARWVMALAAAARRAQTFLLSDVDGRACIGVTVSPGPHAGVMVLVAAPLRPTVGRPVRKALVSALDLTPTEAMVVAELMAGRTAPEIAANYNLSPSTINNHVAGARRALRDIGIVVNQAAGIAAVSAQIAAVTPRPRRALITTDGDDDADD